MSTDNKFGLADRLRDSALLIRDQIDGQDGDAVYLDLELLADEIEEMESAFENEDARSSFLSFTQDDGRNRGRDLLQQGVKLLDQAVQSSIGPSGQNGSSTVAGSPLRKNPGKKRQQANKK